MKQAELTRRILQRKNRNRIFKGIFLASTLVGVVALAVLLIDILIKGAGWLTWDFITGTSSRIPEKNGIWPALIGTLWLMMITAPLTFIIGVATAIYLEEYAKDNWFSRFVQMNISNLAGVPSIVYGLLGLTVFVRVMHFGNSILSGALTLTLLILPILIVSAQEAIRAVPVSQRQASYALGANKWQTVTKVVLPSALPGILTGSILAFPGRLVDGADHRHRGEYPLRGRSRRGCLIPLRRCRFRSSPGRECRIRSLRTSRRGSLSCLSCCSG